MSENYGVINVVLKELYSRDEAAQVLSISERTLFDLERAGEVDVVRIGRSVKITRESILRYVASLSEDAQSARGEKRALEFVRDSASRTIAEATAIKQRAPHLGAQCDELIKSAKKNLEWVSRHEEELNG